MRWFVLALVLSASPAYAATIHVAAGGSLSDAITAAKCGDTITLEPAAVYQQPQGFILTAKGCTEALPITIKTLGATVTERNRCTNSAGGVTLAKVQSTGDGAQAIKTDDNADYWILEGLEITATGANGSGMVRIGEDIETVADNLPVGVKVIGNYIHKVGEEKRGLAYNAGEFTARWNCIRNFRDSGADSQAIAGWNATGPCLIDDNYLHAASENVLFGGSDPGVKGLVASDCVITNNTLEKDPAWCPTTPGDAATGKRLSVKNLFELKSARRFRIENNDMRYSCVDAQDGWAVLFTTQNQGGACTWCVVEDIVFRFNRIRDVASGVSISARDAEGQPSGVMVNMLIEHNLIVTNVAKMGPGGTGFGIGSSPMSKFVIQRNTVINEGTFMLVSDRRSGIQSTGVVVKDNLARHGFYGVVSDQGVGTPTFTYYWAPGYVFDNNVLAGGLAAGYDLSYYPAPATKTAMPTQATFESGFVSYAWPFTVKPDGIFAGMGALPSTAAPEPIPIPPPDPCVVLPLTVTVTKWPTGRSGKKSGTWDSSPDEVDLRRAEFLWTPQRFEASDTRGCSVTVVR